MESDNYRLYNKRFFDAQASESYQSALAVLPFLVKQIQPRRVIDFGCGVGTWLKACLECGVPEVLGVEGPWVDEEKLLIPREHFLVHDLRQEFTQDESADLAISLEVGEHLPEASAEALVRSLTRLAPVVLFSAAVPAQTGTGHINEQWPDYWRKLFTQHQFVCLDIMRPRFWNDARVGSWYRQNMFLYIREEHLAKQPRLQDLMEESRPDWLYPAIHPEMYQKQVLQIEILSDPANAPLRRLLPALPRKLLRLPHKLYRYFTRRGEFSQ